MGWMFFPSRPWYFHGLGKLLILYPDFRELFLCHFSDYFFSLLFCPLRTRPSWVPGALYPKVLCLSLTVLFLFMFHFLVVGRGLGGGEMSSACLPALIPRLDMRKEQNSICSTAHSHTKPIFRPAFPCFPRILLSLGPCACIFRD